MRKKQIVIRSIWILLTILWMTVIFGFSADTADESSRLSLDVGKVICRIFVPEYEQMEESRQEIIAEQIEHPVRKSAHATEYMILGILLSLSAGNAEDGKKTQRNILWCMGIAIAYAASDELHQLWSAGRSCRFTDVLIDSAGSLTGIAFVYGMRKVYINRRKRFLKKEKNRK